MIDYTTTRQIIESELSDNFTTCDIQYENVPLMVDNPESYIAVFDRQSFSESVSMDEDDAHMRGEIIIQIFTKLGTGTSGARDIAQDLTDLLSSKDLDGIITDTPMFISAQPNERYYQHNLIIPYVMVTGENPTC